MRERLVSADRWGINISANEGKIIQFLISLAKAKKIVEVGTLFGYSTVWIARSLPIDGRVWTIERDHEAVRQARKGFEGCGVAEKIVQLEGEAVDLLNGLSAQGPFDMIFIDANKSAYPQYLEWAADHIRPGGLIIADNTLLGGHVAADEKPESLSRAQYTEMRRFNDLIANDARFFGTILPTDEGLTVAIRR
ncbi:MAG: O-methyltransferase [Proteobacteria bacterium]|nr:MAG: O-methyltransferase [Pseudomonadota bacterium]